MKILIFGSRSIEDFDFLNVIMMKIISDHRDIIVIEGDAIGTDKLAGLFADTHGFEKRLFLADWKAHGKAAGVIRSEEMVKECDRAVGFWDGASKGTMHTVNFLVKYKKPYILFTKKGESWEKEIHH
jgi:hypothetical protein